MMWLPFSRYISATPLMARLSLSVAPEVKMISLVVAPTSLAMRSRAISVASSAAQPNEWLRLAELPNSPLKYGNISSSTRGSTGVVAWLSMYTGSFTPLGVVCVLIVLLPSLNLSGQRYQLGQFFGLPMCAGLFAHVCYGDAAQYIFDSLIHLLQRFANGAQIALLAVAVNGDT